MCKEFPPAWGRKFYAQVGWLSSKEQPKLKNSLSTLLPKRLNLPSYLPQVKASSCLAFTLVVTQWGNLEQPAVGRLQSFRWASKSGSGLPGSISQTSSLAQGREVDAPVPGSERQNWHRGNKVGLVVPFAVSRPGARDIHWLKGKNMTYLTPHTTACLSAPATTALSASQRSAIGKAEGIATLLPGRTMPWAACYFAVPIPSLTLHKTDLLLQEEG